MPRPPPIRLLPITCLALLAACTDGGAARRSYLQSLVGQPEAELIRTLGVPTRSYDVDGRRFVAYEERRLDALPSPFLVGGFGGFRGGYGFAGAGFYDGAFASDIVERRCETTFEIAGSRVQNWQLRGNACT